MILWSCTESKNNIPPTDLPVGVPVDDAADKRSEINVELGLGLLDCHCKGHNISFLLFFILIEPFRAQSCPVCVGGVILEESTAMFLKGNQREGDFPFICHFLFRPSIHL